MSPRLSTRPAASPAGFRFRPPPVRPPPELRWVLTRAFASEAAPLASADPRASPSAPPADDSRLALAERLGLLPRIASRTDLPAAVAELGPAAAERLRSERALAMARELALDETLAEIAHAAAIHGLAPIVLKGRALVLAGWSAPGTRPATDLDLLLPSTALRPFRNELLRRGFAETGERAHEHHLAPLRRSNGETVELHRHLPGLRLSGRSSATWEELDRAGLHAALSDAGRFAPVRVPARDVLLAHAVVHALAQHGLAAQYRGWLVVGDLIDLGAANGIGDARSWTARDVSDAEWDAALALAAHAAAGVDPFELGETDRAAVLARHFLACALDEEYAEALKTRRLESPVTDRGLAAARLRMVAKALVPPPAELAGRSGRLGRLLRWAVRPFRLLGKAWRAGRAARRGALGRKSQLD